MPPFLVACWSAGQRPLIVRWSVEVDMGFGTKPSGKWGARILIASSNGPFSMFFCMPSLPPAAVAARLSFTTNAANIQFTLPGRLPRPSARRRAGPDSSRMQARNLVIPSSISTISSRAASLSSSSSSATACLAACKAAIARESDLLCFATSSARRSASYVHISDIRLLTCRQNSTRFSLGTRASSASCRSTSAPSSAPATSSHRCPSTLARCSAAPTSSHRRRARSSGASSSPFSVFVTPSHRHHRRFEGGWRGAKYIDGGRCATAGRPAPRFGDAIVAVLPHERAQPPCPSPCPPWRSTRPRRPSACGACRTSRPADRPPPPRRG